MQALPENVYPTGNPPDSGSVLAAAPVALPWLRQLMHQDRALWFGSNEPSTALLAHCNLGSACLRTTCSRRCCRSSSCYGSTRTAPALLVPYLPAAALGFLVPYLERLLRRSLTPAQSNTPLTTLYFTPGRSFTRPP
jgi:hypothetical protein